MKHNEVNREQGVFLGERPAEHWACDFPRARGRFLRPDGAWTCCTTVLRDLPHFNEGM